VEVLPHVLSSARWAVNWCYSAWNLRNSSLFITAPPPPPPPPPPPGPLDGAANGDICGRWT